MFSGRQPSYSTKVFLGGVPWDITEAALIQVRMFKSVRNKQHFEQGCGAASF
jgi:hypothetical protein